MSYTPNFAAIEVFYGLDPHTFGPDPATRRWRPLKDARHLDGRPLSPDEVAVVRRGTVNDLRAAHSLHRVDLDISRDRLARDERACAILEKYAASDGDTLGELWPHMTSAERAEITEWAALAPDWTQ